MVRSNTQVLELRDSRVDFALPLKSNTQWSISSIFGDLRVVDRNQSAFESVKGSLGAVSQV